MFVALNVAWSCTNKLRSLLITTPPELDDELLELELEPELEELELELELEELELELLLDEELEEEPEGG